MRDELVAEIRARVSEVENLPRALAWERFGALPEDAPVPARLAFLEATLEANPRDRAASDAVRAIVSACR